MDDWAGATMALLLALIIGFALGFFLGTGLESPGLEDVVKIRGRECILIYDQPVEGKQAAVIEFCKAE